jgi:dTDP-4-dehydrorhamnose 3,5-epimerase
MRFHRLKIKDLILIKPEIYDDDRGFFYESYNKAKFDEFVGLNVNFVQDNYSKSNFGVLRGLHMQTKPYEQGKLVRVVHGEVFDVAVDMRKNSSTFGHWEGVNLSDINHNQLWIPEGFAHAFLVLSDEVLFQYKTTNFYNKESEVTINFDDSDINIKWPTLNLKNYIISDKDKKGISLKNFVESDYFRRI